MSESLLRYEPREDGNVVVTETGEIISYDEYLDRRSIEKDIQRAVDRKIRDTNREVNGEQQCKKQKDWLPNYHFVKTIIGNYLDWSDNMDVYERGLMHLMIGLVEWETNKVIVDGENITNGYIRDKLKIGVDTLARTFNSLEEKNIIKRVGVGKQREIYINPLYVYQGKGMSNDTLKMFNII